MKEEKHTKWFEIVGLDKQEEPVQIYFYKEIGSENFDERRICAEEFCRELDEIPKDRQVILRMNSRGGSFYDGLAIAHKIHDRGKVHCYIDGNCASAASVVAMACEKVIAGEGTSVLIHNSRGSFENMDVNTLKDFVKNMEDVDLQMANIYARKSGKPLSYIQALMNRGERLSAETALSLGLVDEIKKINTSANGIPFAEDTEKNSKSYISMNEKEQTKTNTGESGQEFCPTKLPPESDMKTGDKNLTHDQLGQLYARVREAELKAFELRKEKITTMINTACAEGRIRNVDIDGWVEACMKDETMLERLEALPIIKTLPISKIDPGKENFITAQEKKLVGVGVKCNSSSVSAFLSYQNKMKKN